MGTYWADWVGQVHLTWGAHWEGRGLSHMCSGRDVGSTGERRGRWQHWARRAGAKCSQWQWARCDGVARGRAFLRHGEWHEQGECSHLLNQLIYILITTAAVWLLTETLYIYWQIHRGNNRTIAVRKLAGLYACAWPRNDSESPLQLYFIG